MVKRRDVTVNFHVSLSGKEFELSRTPQDSWKVMTMTLMNSISANSFAPLMRCSLCLDCILPPRELREEVLSQRQCGRRIQQYPRNRRIHTW